MAGRYKGRRHPALHQPTSVFIAELPAAVMPIQWIEALSLRQKMMALNLFGITATLLVTLALFSLIYFVTARQRLTDSAEATARQLAQNTAAMLAFGVSACRATTTPEC